ncbi:glycosyltransferase [Melioribacteraceae bacterium 4301-Me]|uniref:glycosyltransferase n=1 Tax=Pyranulibacter aquaticus TaxID=3163344 RepID=UPI00359B7AC5
MTEYLLNLATKKLPIITFALYTKLMKIKIISSAYPLRGGISHFTGLLFKELKKNHDLEVITFKRQYPKLFFPGKSQTEAENEIEKIDTKILVDSINPLNWLMLGNKIKKEKPDLIIFKYWMPFFAPCFGTISRIAKKNKTTKVLVICDNIIPHEKKVGDIALTRYFFSVVDYFILMSETVKRDLIKIKKDAKYKLLFHPIYSNFGELIDKQAAKEKLGIKSEKNILFFGFIRKYKGLDILLKAVALLKDKIDLNLIVAGEFYEDENKYLSLIKQLDIEKKVTLHNDFIPTADVKYYFSAADVVVLPYKDATQSGIVQIANNFNKPVIATKVGGLTEMIEDGKTGFLIEKENPEQLADTIIRFYEENKEFEFTQNIKAEVEKYSWQKFTAEMMEILKN